MDDVMISCLDEGVYYVRFIVPSNAGEDFCGSDIDDMTYDICGSGFDDATFDM